MAKKSKSPSPFEGRWRITAMKVWSQDVVDAEVEGFVEFGLNGLGSFQFAYVSGDIDYRDSTRDGKPSVEWSWDGNDEMDAAKGRGWAVIDEDRIHGVIAIHHADQSEFEAIRKEATVSKKRPIKKPVGKAEKPALFNVQAAALAKNATLAYLDADERGVKNKTVEQFPLDGDERATVAALPVIPAILKKKLEKKATLTIVDVISFVVVISESFADAEPKKQMALLGIAQKLMDCLKENIVKPKSAAKAKKEKSTSTAYQLKIAVADIKPPIWRRIQVPDCTLFKLNKIRGTCSAAFDATGILRLGINFQHLLDLDNVFPIVAHVVGVPEFVDTGLDEPTQFDLAGAGEVVVAPGVDHVVTVFLVADLE